MSVIIRKLLAFFSTLLLVSILTFLIFQVMPGDPALAMLGLDAEEHQLELLRKEFNLDSPLHLRYLYWLSDVLQGDLGTSIRFQESVNTMLLTRLPVTLSLTFLSLGFVILLAIPLGVMAASTHRGILDYLITISTQLGMAIPSFWLGILLMMLFGLVFKWIDPLGYVPWEDNVFHFLKSLLLPALAIAIPQIAVVVRYLRAAFLDELKLDYVRTAKSKGLAENIVLYKHVFRNAMIPVLTVFGLIVARILAGSIVLEQVFSLPGIGRLLITSISYRDYPMISGTVLYIAVAVVSINLCIDLIYRFLDPRIRLD